MKYQGVVCDRAKKLGREYMTREECNQCVQRPDHECSFNGKVLRMLWGDSDHEPNRQVFSPTRLMGCPRARYLEAANAPQLLDPYKAWNALRGTITHAFFEDTPLAPGVQFEVTEERFETTIETAYGPQTFVGKPDLIEVLYADDKKLVVKLTDWKSKKDIGHDLVAASEDHAKQVNMYAYLLVKCLPGYLGKPHLDVVVDELEIFYFDMGKVRRFNSKCSLVDRGKLLYPRYKGEYEEIELAQLKMKSMAFMHDFIRTLIEDAIEASQSLPAPYEGDKARLCPYCPLQKACVERGSK